MKQGRPTIFTKELADEILKRISEGESVRSITRNEEMPNASTVHAWVLDNDVFSKHYARAKDIGAETEAEELEEIARTEPDVQRARLIVDTKKWTMSKKLPRKYGDKLDVTTAGEPIQQVTGMIIQKDNGDKVFNKE